MSDPVGDAVAQAYQDEWLPVLATTVRLARDLDLAEDCAHDAFERALQCWPSSGVPARPGAWLTTTARNRVRDVLRRRQRLECALPLLVSDEPGSGPEGALEDDRLRLIFTCCHPSLSREAQIALTLRLVCGLTTSEVAHAFLVPTATMAARITRAKQKISMARIPYRVPLPDQLAERTGVVLETVHLIFTTGHTAPIGRHLVRRDLVDHAVGLARTLHLIMPTNSDVGALLALFLLLSARAGSRQAASGRMLLLSEQDRTRWDRQLIEEGVGLLTTVLARNPPSRFAVEAAIAAVHAEAPTWQDTDWGEIVGLYGVLLQVWPSPVVKLNRAVALGFRDGPERGLEALAPLLGEPALAGYGYLQAARADFLGTLRRWPEAATAYEEAVALCQNDVEQQFLIERLKECQRQN